LIVKCNETNDNEPSDEELEELNSKLEATLESVKAKLDKLPEELRNKIKEKFDLESKIGDLNLNIKKKNANKDEI
jgi:ElaB/YqjD/DUF883 family membrane-anchored ribosome-binding protein